MRLFARKMWDYKAFFKRFRFLKSLITSKTLWLLVGIGLFWSLDLPKSLADSVCLAPSLENINANSYELFLQPAGLNNGFSVISAIITAYSSSVDETDGDPYITASGKYVREGVIANNNLPFGTKVKIPALYGDKIFVVEDRMADRYNGRNRFDIWMNSKDLAISFGVQAADLVILD